MTHGSCIPSFLSVGQDGDGKFVFFISRHKFVYLDSEKRIHVRDQKETRTLKLDIGLPEAIFPCPSSNIIVRTEDRVCMIDAHVCTSSFPSCLPLFARGLVIARSLPHVVTALCRVPWVGISGSKGGRAFYPSLAISGVVQRRACRRIDWKLLYVFCFRALCAPLPPFLMQPHV